MSTIRTASLRTVCRTEENPRMEERRMAESRETSSRIAASDRITAANVMTNSIIAMVGFEFVFLTRGFYEEMV